MAEYAAPVDTSADFGVDPKGLVSRWSAEIKAAEKRMEKWHKRARKIYERYRDEKRAALTTTNKKLNILWSNVETLKPAVLNRSPVPIVSRRYRDRDPVARLASTILERCLQTDIDLTGGDEDLKQARDDYLLSGRGILWQRYEDEREPDMDPETGEEFEAIAEQHAPWDYVAYDCFLHGEAKTWKRVPWVAKKLELTRGQMVSRFGEVGKLVTLERKTEGVPKDEDSEVFKKGIVWEIWDKETKRVLWICPEYEEGPLDMQDDFLHLRGFFPCPKPLYGSMTPDSLIPLPDYAQYQDQAEEIDRLTERISVITEAIRLVGVYNAALTELQQLLDSSGDNRMIGVENWGQFAQGNGLKGAVDFLPVEGLIVVLEKLYLARAQCLQNIYEVTGISDIIRGSSVASETATAQRIKGNFATLRLDDRQREVQRFARDAIRLRAEVIAEHFTPEMLIEMSGVMDLPEMQPQVSQNPANQNIPQTRPQPEVILAQAIDLLKSDFKRTFNVDIETDSTIEPDETEEKAARVELLTAVVPFMEKAAQIGQVTPQAAPLMAELLLFAVRAFKVGRTVEASFEQAIEDLKANPPQPQPDPKIQIEQERLKIDAQRAQQDAQIKQQQTQADLQATQAKAAAQIQAEREKLVAQTQMEREKAAAQIELEKTIAMLRLQLEESIAQQKAESDRQVAKYDAETRRMHAKDKKAA